MPRGRCWPGPSRTAAAVVGCAGCTAGLATAATLTPAAWAIAAVVAAADDDGLLKPKAFVVLKHGADAEGIDKSIKALVQEDIGKWKYPRWVEVVEDLPKTATGKIQRFKLRDGA